MGNISYHTKKTSRIASWNFRGVDGGSVGVSLEHYRCQKAVATHSKATRVSDTVEFCHQRINPPQTTPEDRVIESINKLTSTLNLEKPDATVSISIFQIVRDKYGMQK